MHIENYRSIQFWYLLVCILQHGYCWKMFSLAPIDSCMHKICGRIYLLGNGNGNTPIADLDHFVVAHFFSPLLSTRFRINKSVEKYVSRQANEFAATRTYACSARATEMRFTCVKYGNGAGAASSIGKAKYSTAWSALCCAPFPHIHMLYAHNANCSECRWCCKSGISFSSPTHNTTHT